MSSNSNYSNSAKRRVVVTGIGALSPLGHDWQTVRQQLHSGRNVIREMHEWKDIEGLNTQLGCTVPHFDLPAHYNRKTMRSMGRVALMATRASELALESAGLLGHPLLKSGAMGSPIAANLATRPAKCVAFKTPETRNSRIATADASPRFRRKNASSHRNSTVVWNWRSLPPMPPAVDTSNRRGSAKICSPPIVAVMNPAPWFGP